MRLSHKSNETFESFVPALSKDPLNNACKRVGHPVEAILLYAERFMPIV